MHPVLGGKAAKGRSPAGLERCSHIAEVIGSNPIVPTPNPSFFVITLSSPPELGVILFRAPPRFALQDMPCARNEHTHHPSGLRRATTLDMTAGPPARSILAFALPLIAGYILQQLYLLINAVIAGRWLGVDALAAIGASTSVMFLVMGFCNGCCAGLAIPIAQAFGASRTSSPARQASALRRMRQCVAAATRIAIHSAALLTVATCLLVTPILHALNTPADILRPARTFLLLQLLTIPLTMAYNLLAAFMRAVGNSRKPFHYIIVASLLNIALDLLLIVRLGMGVEGAGIATLLSQATAAALCLRFILRRMPLLIPRPTERKPPRSRTIELLNNGIPMGLQFSITGIGIIMLQSANNALGTTYIAAFTAAMRIKYLFTCVFENLGAAMATYCGQNIGARNLPRIGQGMRAAIILLALYTLAVFAIVQGGADAMMSLFASPDEQDMVPHAARLMRIATYFYPALALLALLRYSIQGLGFSNLALLSGATEMVARMAVSLLLVPAFAWMGVCFGDPVAWIAADCFLVPCYLMLLRHLKHSLRPKGPELKTGCA